MKAMAASILRKNTQKVVFIYVVESSYANIGRRNNFNSIKVFWYYIKRH